MIASTSRGHIFHFSWITRGGNRVFSRTMQLKTRERGSPRTVRKGRRKYTDPPRKIVRGFASRFCAPTSSDFRVPPPVHRGDGKIADGKKHTWSGAGITEKTNNEREQVEGGGLASADLACLACSIFIIMSEGEQSPEIGDVSLSFSQRNAFSRDIAAEMVRIPRMLSREEFPNRTSQQPIGFAKFLREVAPIR